MEGSRDENVEDDGDDSRSVDQNSGNGENSRDVKENVNFGETWVYESIVGAFPLISVSGGEALAIQFFIFESGVLIMAYFYDLWSAFPAGTATVLVAVVGSGAMLDFGRRIRSLPAPEPYRRYLFGSSIEIVLSHLAYIGLITYLFVIDPRSDPALIEELFGEDPPAFAVYLMLLVLWDVSYRIGTNWWASVVGLWRTYRYRDEFSPETAKGFRRIDLDNILFGGFQIILVPFVSNHPLLVFAVAGHVVAVMLVSGLSLVLMKVDTEKEK